MNGTSATTDEREEETVAEEKKSKNKCVYMQSYYKRRYALCKLCMHAG